MSIYKPSLLDKIFIRPQLNMLRNKEMHVISLNTIFERIFGNFHTRLFNTRSQFIHRSYSICWRLTWSVISLFDYYDIS